MPDVMCHSPMEVGEAQRWLEDITDSAARQAPHARSCASSRTVAFSACFVLIYGLLIGQKSLVSGIQFAALFGLATGISMGPLPSGGHGAAPSSSGTRND